MNSAPPPMRYIAKTGERIICPNGHMVAMFRRNVRVGEVFDADFLRFSASQGDVQKQGRIPPCHCGAHWHRVAQWRQGGNIIDKQLQVFVEREWRACE